MRYVEQVQHTLNFVVDWTFTLRTLGGRRSDGRILSPAPRSYIFTARLWSTRFVPGIFKFHQRSFSLLQTKNDRIIPFPIQKDCSPVHVCISRIEDTCPYMYQQCLLRLRVAWAQEGHPFCLLRLLFSFQCRGLLLTRAKSIILHLESRKNAYLLEEFITLLLGLELRLLNEMF